MKFRAVASLAILSASLLLAVALGSPPARAATAFLSTVAPGGGATVSNPSITLAPGASTTLYLYFTPAPGDAAYLGIGIDLNNSVSGLVSATGFSVANPDILVGAIDINDRWSTPTGGSIVNGPSVLVSNMVGVAVSGPAGLDVTNDGSGGITDGGYDPSSGSFLFGSIVLEAGLTPGSTDLSLAVGSTLIVRSGDTAGSGPPMFFGAGEGSSVDGTTLGATGGVPDATITIIPEPGARFLVLLAGFALLLNRKRTAFHRASAGPLVLLLALAIISTPPARAGFKYKPPQFDGYPLGDGSATPANMAKIAPTKTRLGEWINARRAAEKPPLPPLAGAALDAAVDAKFDAIRANIAAMLELIACQNKDDFGAKVAACGKALFDKGSICVDFGTASQGAQYCDSSPACEKDKINLNITEIPCTNEAATCYTPQFYDGLMTLYEEIRHAQQDWTAPVTGDPNVDRAKRQLKSACNEYDVDEETRPFHDALCTGLENLQNDDPHGQTEPIIKKILDKIAALPDDATRDAIIADLKAEAEAQHDFDTRTSICYLQSKIAITEYCNGDKTFAEMNECLGRIRWDIPGQTNPVPFTRPVASGGSDSGDLEYRDGATTEIIPLPLTGIFDVKFGQSSFDTHPDSDFILISGIDPGTGFGTVFVLPDGNDDGLFFGEAPPVPIVPPSPDLCWTLELIRPCDPAGQWMILDGKTGLIYFLLDTNFDGVPDALDPTAINPGGPLPPWVREARCIIDPSLPNPFLIQGLETQGGEGSGNYAPGMDIVQIDSNDPLGPFGNQQLIDLVGDVLFPPVPLGPVHIFHTEILVMAPPGAQVVVLQLDPLTGQPFGPPLGSQIFPPGIDVLPIPVGFPPSFGQPLFVGLFDQTLGTASEPIFVGQPGDMNCDGSVNALDIEPFVEAVIDPIGFFLLTGKNPYTTADINGDGEVNALDIEPFVALLVEVSGPPAPAEALPLADLLPAGLDSDGDGMSDGDELIAGTDYTDPLSVLRVRSISATATGQFALAWESVSDRRYAIDFSPEGTPETWSTVTPEPLPGTGELVEHSVPVPADTPGGLFRVRVVTEE